MRALTAMLPGFGEQASGRRHGKTASGLAINASGNSPGNYAQRKSTCACGGGCPRCRAAGDAPGDLHELEAGRTAFQVPLNRGHAAGGQLSGKSAEAFSFQSQPSIQRVRAARDTATHNVSPGVERTLSEAGQPLEPKLRQDMEGRFGHDFNKVRVHTDPSAAHSARTLNAHAYAVGRHLVFDAGEYRPDTAAGLHLLAHELAHVVQQGTAPYRPERGIKLSSRSSPLEQEADLAANRLFTGQHPNVHIRSDANAVQRLQRAEHGTYVSTVDDSGKAYLEAGAQFYRTWGYPNVKRVANMSDILDDLDRAKDTIEKFRIVAHGSPAGLDLGLLPEVGDAKFFSQDSAEFTTEARFRKEFTNQHLVEESFFGSIYDALWKDSKTQALLTTMGGSKDAPDEDSNLGILLRAIIDARFLQDVQLDTGGQPKIPNVDALKSFIQSRRSLYGQLVVADAAKDKQGDVRTAIAKLPGLVPGVMTAAPLAFGPVTADEAKELADSFVENPGKQSGLKKSLSKSVVEGAGGPYLRKLRSVKSKMNDATHIEIRGCNVGSNTTTMDALRDYFGNPDTLPSMSAPDLYQYFFQLGVSTYGPAQQAELEAAFGDPDLGLEQGYENITRLKAGEMTRVVNETKLSELATKYGFNTDAVRKLNPEIDDPDALHMGQTVWLRQRTVVPVGIYQKLEDFCKDYLGNSYSWPKVWAANPWITDPSALPPDGKITVPPGLLTPPIVSSAPTAKDFAAAVRGGKTVTGLASKSDTGKPLDPSRPVLRVDDQQRAKALGAWLASQQFDPKGRTAEVLSKRFGKSGAEFEKGRQGTYVQFLSVRYPNAEDPIFPDDPRYDKHIINRP